MFTLLISLTLPLASFASGIIPSTNIQCVDKAKGINLVGQTSIGTKYILKTKAQTFEFNSDIFELQKEGRDVNDPDDVRVIRSMKDKVYAGTMENKQKDGATIYALPATWKGNRFTAHFDFNSESPPTELHSDALLCSYVDDDGMSGPADPNCPTCR